MLALNIKRKQKGFTLIEIMIALMLGLIVIGGALSIYISTIRSSTDITNSARLNYDLDSVMQLVVNDIRRSGYWSQAIAESDARDNPFMLEGAAGNTNIFISKKTGEADNSCIVYSYEGETGNGTVDTNEYYGFRMNGDGIDMRSSVTDVANASCDDPGDWENIIDTSKIVITALTFNNTSFKCLNTTSSISYNTPCASVTAANLPSDAEAIETRQIGITVQGNVDNDSTVTKRLTAIIKVRNDRVFTQP